jgi:hypothetical protein
MCYPGTDRSDTSGREFDAGVPADAAATRSRNKIFDV